VKLTGWKLWPALEGFETDFSHKTITLRFVSDEEFEYAASAIERLVEVEDTGRSALIEGEKHGNV